MCPDGQAAISQKEICDSPAELRNCPAAAAGGALCASCWTFDRSPSSQKEEKQKGKNKIKGDKTGTRSFEIEQSAGHMTAAEK